MLLKCMAVAPSCWNQVPSKFNSSSRIRCHSDLICLKESATSNLTWGDCASHCDVSLMHFSRIGVSSVAHVLFVNGFTHMHDRKFLRNRYLVYMQMKIIMKNSPHRTIGNSKGRPMFVRWCQHCLKGNAADAPTHEGDWTVLEHNFIFPPFERDH